ncbi:MAG: hypothetical protein QXX64_05035 [Nitrososphaera sp.]|uniref:Uncharacterized protein n=1 Tax=Nitrososphaera gargensis (strain Ga9.2) TaxID=1237085 RepID=K0IJB4_NITGG|nr:hypothetical protein [Candidatus Nitrososphaera gargensis]AFU59193.1 hypothetical protein Ngar_c22630 [Candidatus Nitrososphaera gargensis Ga9.2]
MSAEIAIIAGSSVAGAISAAFIEKLSRLWGGDKKKPRPTNAVRAELLSLLFEKNLAAEAITRVYEASQEGRIDRLERDRLLLKYKQQLDSLNQKIAIVQPVADFADITELRNNLVSLLENKISALDQKLMQMKPGISPPDVIDARVQKIIAETSKVQTTPVDQKPFKAEEKSIDQLQKEIVQALQRLEQVEIDKD